MTIKFRRRAIAPQRAMPGSGRNPHSRSKRRAAAATTPVAQNEFGLGEIETRGAFGKTDRPMFEGHDLDVPTHLRKGIRLTR